jgi:hypothetical protein
MKLSSGKYCNFIPLEYITEVGIPAAEPGSHPLCLCFRFPSLPPIPNHCVERKGPPSALCSIQRFSDSNGSGGCRCNLQRIGPMTRNSRAISLSRFCLLSLYLVCMIVLIEQKWPDGSPPLRQCDYYRNFSPFQTT